jgi:hypothetical protein
MMPLSHSLVSSFTARRATRQEPNITLACLAAVKVTVANSPTLGFIAVQVGLKRGEKLHDPCAFKDDEAGLSEMNACPNCWDARKPPAEDS